MGFGTPPGVTKHTELTDKEVAAIIDHADLSVSDAKLLSGVGLSDGQICKLPVAVLDQILKRGAAAWVVGAVPTPVLEGDYSTWTQQWVSGALTNVDSIWLGEIDLTNNRILILDDWRYFAILNLEDGSIISQETIPAFGVTPTNCVNSILAKYSVLGISPTTTFRVYKNGTVEETKVVAGVSWSGFLISYNGEYIIALDSNTKKVYCFKGS